MPLHDFRCPVGHITEAQVSHGVDWISCTRCGECTPECKANHIPGYEVLHLGTRAEKVFLVAPRGYVQPDICYDSPIDGRPITSKQARIEDLKRNQCREYDPTEKDEVIRNKARAEAELDKSIDDSVDATLAGWSTRKKELLEQEIRSGADTHITRKAPDGT